MMNTGLLIVYVTKQYPGAGNLHFYAT